MNYNISITPEGEIYDCDTQTEAIQTIDRLLRLNIITRAQYEILFTFDKHGKEDLFNNILIGLISDYKRED